MDATPTAGRGVRRSRAALPAGRAEAMGQVLNGRYPDGGPGGAPREGSLAAGFVDTRDPLTRAPENRGLYVDVVQTSREVAPGAALLRDEVLEHMRLPGDALVALTRTDRDERGVPERGAERAVAERVVAGRGAAERDASRGMDGQGERPEPTPAQRFGTYREAALQTPRADGTPQEAWRAEWAAAHQLLRTVPGLSREALVAAMRDGGATGATATGAPADREAYLVTTAGRALESAQRQPTERQQAPRGGERGR